MLSRSLSVLFAFLAWPLFLFAFLAWPLYVLSLFYLRLVITPLWYLQTFVSSETTLILIRSIIVMHIISWFWQFHVYFWDLCYVSRVCPIWCFMLLICSPFYRLINFRIVIIHATGVRYEAGLVFVRGCWIKLFSFSVISCFSGVD